MLIYLVSRNSQRYRFLAMAANSKTQKSRWCSVARESFLNPLLLYGAFDSFAEFEELFPSSLRDHQDVRLLYKAFQRQRKVLQKQAKNRIEQYEGQEAQIASDVGSGKLKEDLTLSDAVKFLEEFAQVLEEECEVTQNELRFTQERIESLCRELRENHIPSSPPEVSKDCSTTIEEAVSLLR